jgi:hypothetical protein
MLTGVAGSIAQNVLPLMVKPVNTSPEDGAVVNTTTPILEWGGGGADTYKVVVKNALGEKVFSAGGTQSDLCTIDGNSFACSVNPADTESELPNGILTWRVTAKSTEGKAKSDPTSFTINYPGSPILTSPEDGATVDPNPVLVWEQVDVALLLYKVKIKNTQTGAKHNTDWIGNAEICAEGVCSYQTDLGQGPYKWKVLVSTFGGEYVSKSEKRTFDVQPPIGG